MSKYEEKVCKMLRDVFGVKDTQLFKDAYKSLNVKLQPLTWYIYYCAIIYREIYRGSPDEKLLCYEKYFGYIDLDEIEDIKKKRMYKFVSPEICLMLRADNGVANGDVLDIAAALYVRGILRKDFSYMKGMYAIDEFIRVWLNSLINIDEKQVQNIIDYDNKKEVDDIQFVLE